MGLLDFLSSPSGGSDFLNAAGQVFGPQVPGLTPDQQQALAMRSLLATGASMLANSGPSRTPTSVGQVIGRGLLAGAQANDEAAKNELSSDLYNQQMLGNKLKNAVAIGRYNLQAGLLGLPKIDATAFGIGSSGSAGGIPSASSASPNVQVADSSGVVSSALPSTAPQAQAGSPSAAGSSAGLTNGQMAQIIRDQWMGIDPKIIANQFPGPSRLAILQSERAAISRNNPSDPRLPQYDAAIAHEAGEPSGYAFGPNGLQLNPAIVSGTAQTSNATARGTAFGNKGLPIPGAPPTSTPSPSSPAPLRLPNNPPSVFNQPGGQPTASAPAAPPPSPSAPSGTSPIGRIEAADAGAAEAAKTANMPSDPVTVTMPDGTSHVFDKNREATQLNAAIAGGGRIYNQNTPEELGQIAADKVVRNNAATQQSAIGRQRQTLDIASSLINDPSFASGKWQDLSLNARAFLSQLVPSLVDSPTVSTQQAFESALARLTFQEAPTLNVKTVRNGMLPLMQQVQGELGSNPNANKAAVLIGTRMADWDLGRIAAIEKSPHAAQAETDYIQKSPVVTPAFTAAIHDTLNSNKFEVPKFTSVDQFMQQFYTPYSRYWTRDQKMQALSIVKNFGVGKNTTGQVFTVQPDAGR